MDIIENLGDTMEYQVKIDAFEGPLDLLLYLMKDMKISIDDINVSQITEQYINFIHQMEQMNLEVASEYLVMAAHLVLIKSKMMLPKTTPIDQEDYEENPEEKLKKRLKIYKMFKELIPMFHELEEERSAYLTKIPTDLSHELKTDIKEVLAEDADVHDLLSAFNRVLRRFMLHKPLKTKIGHQTITIDERIVQLRLFIIENKCIKFSDLYALKKDKEYVVVTFMAILELAREKFLRITQGKLFDEIYLDYNIEGGENNA